MNSEDKQQEIEDLIAQKVEEERLDGAIKGIRNSHEEIAYEFRRNLRRIENSFSHDYLSKEERMFLEEQRELIKKMERDEDDLFCELEYSLNRQKNSINERKNGDSE